MAKSRGRRSRSLGLGLAKAFEWVSLPVVWATHFSFSPPLKLRVFVDDITALLTEKNKEVTEMAKKVMKKLKEEVEKKGPNCQSLKMEWKERAR